MGVVFLDSAKTLDSALIRLLQILGEGIVVYNPAGKILWCNQAAGQAVGRNPDQLIGRPVRDEFASVDFNREISTASLKDRDIILEIRHLVLDGNHPTLKAMVLRDITAAARKDLELREVRQQNDTFEVILNSLDHGVQVVNEQGVVTFYNPVQEKLDNMKKDFVVGKHMTEIYKLDEESSFLLRVLKYGKPIDDRQDYITASGKLVNIISTAVPLWQGKKMVGAVAITKDFDNMWEFSQRVLAPGTELSGKPRGKHREPLFTRKKLYTFADIIGQNRLLGHAIDLAQKAAATTSPVLISGETGTGKELFAQSIHAAGNRRHHPFMAINCAAIPENLLEGILFGTVPGAFTGAIDRPGLFEQSSGGTVFLDEVNSMPLALQAKLLRVIQEGVVRRVGGTQDRSIDIRIISSSNEEPMTAIQHQTLRSDLFYRLGVVHISVPPLRSRKDDLPLLTDYFIHEKKESCRKLSGGFPRKWMPPFPGMIGRATSASWSTSSNPP